MFTVIWIVAGIFLFVMLLLGGYLDKFSDNMLKRHRISKKDNGEGGQSLSEPTGSIFGTDKKQKKSHGLRNFILITVAIVAPFIVLVMTSNLGK